MPNIDRLEIRVRTGAKERRHLTRQAGGEQISITFNIASRLHNNLTDQPLRIWSRRGRCKRLQIDDSTVLHNCDHERIVPQGTSRPASQRTRAAAIGRPVGSSKQL